MSADLFERARAEVIDRHADFVAMGRGTAAFDRALFERAFDEGFGLVSPDGSVMARAEILAHVEGLARLGDPAFEIGISDVVEVWRDEGAVLVSYVESQMRGGRASRRRSTALFVEDDAAPHRVAWRHLHETWMPVA